MNIECEPVIKDLRKKKFSNSYVSTLQNQVNNLEKFISILKNSEPEKQSELLQAFQISNNLSPTETSEDEFNKQDSQYLQHVKKTEVVIEKVETGQISVYGKPSIFIPPTKNKKVKTKVDFQYFHCPVILKYISEFFKWQYMEYNIYIYRESFLTDFFRDMGDLKESLQYCTEGLIFAICACGSNMDFGDDVFLYGGVLYDTPEKFYNRSRHILFQKLNNNSCNSITDIQTSLCLAFFDLGRGRTLSAWILSGIAFRIGLHMGFELNLKNSEDPGKSNGAKLLTDYDHNVKSRIYWGCRIADYYISFVLGRMPTLENLHATIPASENLPVLPGIEYFLYFDPVANDSKIYNISRPLKQLITLFKLVHKYHSIIFRQSAENTRDDSQFQTIRQLGDFNLKIYEWKNSLGDELYWTKSELKTNGYNPNFMCLRYQYYLVLLSFNRYFVNTEGYNSGAASPREVAVSAIEDVYYSISCFKSHHPIRYISLNAVYLCILSITILQKLPDTTNLPLRKHSLIDFFGMILKESSKSWELAKSAYEIFRPLFKNSEINTETSSAMDRGGSKEAEFDFTENKNRIQQDLSDLDESLIPSLNYS